MTRKQPNSGLILGGLAALLGGCSPGPSGIYEEPDGPPPIAVDLAMVRDAVPRAEPVSRYGNPASYKVNGKQYQTLASAEGYVARGIASWYGTKFHGRLTSTREPYDMYAMTAAHTTLPLPSYARVTNLRNGRSVVVKINDRGPFHANRLIDLSYAAAAKLDIVTEGTGLVEVRTVNPGRADATTIATTPAAPTSKLAVPDASATATPGTSAATVPAAHIYMQVGAFSLRVNAERLRDKLHQELRQAVRLHQANSGSGPVFRVQIGPLRDVPQADSMLPQLAQMGIHQTHIIID